VQIQLKSTSKLGKREKTHVKKISRHEWYQTSRVMGAGSIIVGLIMTSSNVFLFIGCWKRQKKLLIPWLVFKMVGILGPMLYENLRL